MACFASTRCNRNYLEYEIQLEIEQYDPSDEKGSFPNKKLPFEFIYRSGKYLRNIRQRCGDSCNWYTIG